ncbi:MAG: T9SS type A sorting domain-containing protein [Bacteroidetes bacterium]|nr:T9SS type A sorting domain-containing protein [Bacteroidota bacterium]
MKKLFAYLLVTIPLICSGNLCFSQIFTETFNYTADPVNGLATQSGGLWTKLNSGDSILVTSGNLNFPGLTTSTGNNVSYGGSGTDYYRAFTNQTSGTVYASFILRITDISLQTTNGGYTIGFMENGSTTVFGATLWIRNNTASGTTQFNLGINPRTTAGNTVWSPSVLDEGTPYLIVIAYQIVPGATNDSVKLWINPTSFNGAEPYPTLMAANTLTDLTTGVQKIFMRQDASGTTPTLTIDEMRVGTTWADVTPSVITGETITVAGGSFNNITIDNSAVTLGGNDTITGTMTLQNGGLISTTTNYTLFFTPTSTNPAEDAANRIIGTAIMQYRPVGTGALNFLSVGMLAGADDLGDVTIQRISGPDGTLGPGINCNWQIFRTNNPSGRDFTLSFPSIYDNGRDMTHAAVFEFGGPISTWYQTGPTVDISALNPRVVTVTLGPGSGFWWSVSDENHKVPVEMASFTSLVNGNDVNLQWSTVYELNNSGFDVERKFSNSDWIKIGNVKGNGTSYSSHDYSYKDYSLASGRYKYRLKQIDYNGNYKYYDLMNEVVIGVPNKFVLMQNYPNPFNPVTQINYELPITNYVSLKIFDMAGKEVASLVNGVKDAGYYSVTFDAKNFSSGTYFYKLTTDNFSAVKKMVVVK